MSKASGSKEPRKVDLSGWNFGDVVAVVDDPHFSPAQGERLQDFFPSGVFSSLGVPGLAVESVLLMAKQAQPEGVRSHVAPISRDDAMQLVERDRLFFPEGEPIAGEVYARHPLRRRDYWPFADFHRLLLHEKSVEVARYLLALGAGDITIRCMNGAGSAGNVNAKLQAPTPADMSAGMGFALDDSGDLSITITGAGRSSDPPGDLIWPDRDPLFKLARDAAGTGAQTFRFGIKTDQSRSVNATVGVSMKGLGLNIGGDYKRWEDLTFTVEARFGSASERNSPA